MSAKFVVKVNGKKIGEASTYRQAVLDILDNTDLLAGHDTGLDDDALTDILESEGITIKKQNGRVI
jgi:hypothetical protein